MRQIRDILRQKWALGLSHRAVAQSLSVGLGTISSVVGRAEAAGLDWPQVQGLTDDALEGRPCGPCRLTALRCLARMPFSLEARVSGLGRRLLRALCLRFLGQSAFGCANLRHGHGAEGVGRALASSACRSCRLCSGAWMMTRLDLGEALRPGRRAMVRKTL